MSHGSAHKGEEKGGGRTPNVCLKGGSNLQSLTHVLHSSKKKRKKKRKGGQVKKDLSSAGTLLRNRKQARKGEKGGGGGVHSKPGLQIKRFSL